MNTKFRTPFSPKKPAPFQEPGISKTQQHFAEETSMAGIISRVMKGQNVPTNPRQASFTDVNSDDFHTMHNKIADIQTQFNSLPAKLRSKFNNQPYQLLRWLENPANAKTAVKLGLVSAAEGEYDPDAIVASHEQLDLEREAVKEAEKLHNKVALKADPEANPGFQKGAKAT